MYAVASTLYNLKCTLTTLSLEPFLLQFNPQSTEWNSHWSLRLGPRARTHEYLHAILRVRTCGVGKATGGSNYVLQPWLHSQTNRCCTHSSINEWTYSFQVFSSWLLQSRLYTGLWAGPGQVLRVVGITTSDLRIFIALFLYVYIPVIMLDDIAEVVGKTNYSRYLRVTLHW